MKKTVEPEHVEEKKPVAKKTTTAPKTKDDKPKINPARVS